MIDVYLDEKYIGTTDNSKEFIKNFKEERRTGKIPGFVNIGFNENFQEVYIETSKGRARRPLIIVENGKPKLTAEHLEKLTKNEMTWSDLINQGIIEYLDTTEEENCLIAINEEELTKDNTHIEISPTTILGICTSLVPYANFVGGSRLIRGSKNSKQGLGLYAANFPIRIDTDVSIMHYPQTPIVRSFTTDIYKFSKHPYGQNVIVAMMSYEGYNMDDATIINKGSIDRGFGRSTYFRPYSSEELRYSGGLTDEITIPDKEVKGYKSEKDYRLLEKDGIVYTGAEVKEEEIIVGKTSPPRFLGELEEFSVAANIRRESSSMIKHGESGIVDLALITENEEGNRLVQVRLRDQRIPELGDKFASRHGQKGVIGLIVPQEDMPFTASGIVPDIIFSPHSIPSRMTISHMLEILAGKLGSLKGSQIDGTIFDSVPEEEVRRQMLELGFKDNGTEIMYNGVTGQEYKVRIYIGSIFYLKLRYMVANKLHARASGRIQLLTRQPIEGRSKGGGLRVGEMEKDCLVAHGASLLLKERFDSDKTVIHVCEECGMVAVYDSFRNKKYCVKCGSNIEINPVEISYAFKLLLDELKSLMIYPKLILKDRY